MDCEMIFSGLSGHFINSENYSNQNKYATFKIYQLPIIRSVVGDRRDPEYQRCRNIDS